MHGHLGLTAFATLLCGASALVTSSPGAARWLVPRRASRVVAPVATGPGQQRARVPVMNSKYDIIQRIHEEGSAHGLGLLSTEDESFNGRHITIDGQMLINFGSCSFLGLELHPELVSGAESALHKYGTQFSSSRSYISAGLYDELESALSQIFHGRPVIATASTTLGHLSSLPTLVGLNDAVVLDQQVHSSVQMAAALLKASGIHVETLRHSRMDQLERRIQKLKTNHERIWYMADGVYSMYGDVVPMHELESLLERHEQFHLYVDDAHGFSWAGKHGCGRVLRDREQHERLVVAVSLNKCFAAAGGALVLPTQAFYERVRHAGPTLVFSGPIQPPMLGAALASARLHLSEGFAAMQAHLANLVAYTNQRFRSLSLPLADFNDTPVFFVPCGIPTVVYSMARTLRDHGCFVNTAVFPAVPMKQGGVRFTITSHHTREDIDHLAEIFANHYSRILMEHGGSRTMLAAVFKRSGVASSLGDGVESMHAAAAGVGDSQLRVRVSATIDDVSPTEWDQLFDGRGPMNHRTLAMFERAFAHNEQQSQNFAWRYVIVSDADDRIVAATFFSIGYVKDDMFAPAHISEHAEHLRLEDEHFLVSKAVVMGSPLSLGSHLHIDESHIEYRAALELIVEAAHQIKAEFGAEKVLFRDFAKQDELGQRISGLGFVEVGLPNRMLLETSWLNPVDYLNRLDSKSRYNVRREILRHESAFEVVAGQASDLDEYYRLYQMVHARGRAINVFMLPKKLFYEAFQHPDFDVLSLYHTNEQGKRRLVSFMLSHYRAEVYSALLVGIDYIAMDATAGPSPYKQALYQTVQRAHLLGAHTIDLACTAELEKRKLGARPQKMCAFMCADDDFSLRAMANL